MENTENSEFPYITDRSNAKVAKFSIKPLFKLKIGDLLEIPFSEGSASFRFRNYDVSFVMCGGTIKNIYRDDTIFSFEIQDDTGSIQCFHKSKHDVDSLLQKITSQNNTDSLLNPEVSVFSNTYDSIIENDNDTNEVISDIISWFQNQIVSKQKIKNIEDIIHVTGHLLENESIRKINVIDFRITEVPEEHADFLLEVKYLYKCVYV